MADEPYANIRTDSLLGPILGQRVVDVTQHDEEEYQEDGEGVVYVHFENGYTLRVVLSEEPGRVTLVSTPAARPFSANETADSTCTPDVTRRGAMP